MEKHLEELKKEIEQQLGWGDSGQWQGKDFVVLSDLIREKTRVILSESTLRRIMGKSAYPHMPSSTTLDTLSQFAGYAGWREFQQRKKTAAQQPAPIPLRVQLNKLRPIKIYALAVLVLVGLMGIGIFWRGKTAPADYKGFDFSSKPVTRDLPNSVVFKYQVGRTGNQPVAIQQSWNPDTRARVPANGHYFTSVYYRPGFYRAKLLVGDHIVKEHSLMIPTKGWLGLIAQSPVPVYLQPEEYVFAGKLAILQPAIAANQVAMAPRPPRTELYNVGNFTRVPANNFSFSVQVRDNYKSGAGICQLVNVGLITDRIPIVIPLSAKGCIANLSVFNGSAIISGQTADLSGFGTDLSAWVDVTCKADGGKLTYSVNGHPAFSCAAPPSSVHIIGIGFTFQGTGEVRAIRLSSGQQQVYQGF